MESNTYLKEDNIRSVCLTPDCETILDAFVNMGVYVVESEARKILYYNRRFKEMCPELKIGMECYKLGRSSCKNCLMESMGEKAMVHTVTYSDTLDDSLEISALKILWHGETPAVIMCVWPRNIQDFMQVANSENSKRGTYDDITGGLTRSGFISTIERMKRNNINLLEYAVLYININDFKAINEIVGCTGGDNLLRNIFARIEHSILYPLIGCRIESDHFVFLVEKSQMELSALQTLLNFDWKYAGAPLFVHCRCGIYNIDDASLEIYRMIDRAKLAKEHIVDEYVTPYAIYDDSMGKEYQEITSAFFTLEKAIENKEFVVYYQPVVDIRTGKIVSAEALVRKIGKDGNIILPGKFIPGLEQTGFISLLDRFVAEDVRRFLYSCNEKNIDFVPISINLSQKDLYDVTFMEMLANYMETSKLPRGSVLIELTESAYAMHEKSHDEYIERLYDAGAEILLDDFGTGYSSFGMFENFRFNRIKLDRSFVQKLGINENVKLVVESIIDMCHKMNMRVVAEGVEREEELEMLREAKCDYIQGFYFSKPLPEAEFLEYMSKHI